MSIDKPRNADTTSQGGSQVRVQRKPLHTVDSAASVPIQPQDNDSQLDSSRAVNTVKQSGNADRKGKDVLKRKSTHDASINNASQQVETRKSTVGMRSSQPKIAKRASPAPVPQVDDADEYEGDEFEEAGTAAKGAGGRASQAKEADEEPESNQKASNANLAASQQSSKKKPAVSKAANKRSLNAQ